MTSTACFQVLPAAAAGVSGSGAGRRLGRLGGVLAGPVLVGALLAGLAGPAAAAPAASKAAPGTGGAVRATVSAGSLPVGQASYPVPAGALFVSPAGSDSAAGSAAAPLRTVGRAVAVAAAGQTVVLRGGDYHENVTTSRPVTIQNYPGEAAWFDGSSPVTGWVADGGRWRADGYTSRFDHSPTYTAGAPDNTTPGWSFTNAAYPMAAYPDQLFVDGVAQQQVKTLAQVGPGSFWVDTAASRLWMGSTPTGHAVRASDQTIALSVRGAGSVIRGIGVRRYATSVPMMGTLRALAPAVHLQNVEVSDNATQGVFLGGDTGSNLVVDHLTSQRNGLMGISANYADGLKATAVRSVGNNDEHFNTSPAAGGFKITRSRGITISGGVFAANNGNGFWTDESTYNATVVGNDFTGNAVHGVSFEISNRAVFADNLFAGNGQVGLKLNDSGDTQVWNNTFIGNGYKPLWIVQDSRQASNQATLGHDPRQAFPDPTMTWTVHSITIGNNIFGRTTSNCLLCVEDAALHRSATTMGITTDGNLYNRAAANAPTWLTVWASGATNPFVYTTLRAFTAATGQETHGAELTGPSVLDSANRPLPAATTLQATTAQPLPAAVATPTHHSAGERHLGAWMY